MPLSIINGTSNVCYHPLTLNCGHFKHQLHMCHLKHELYVDYHLRHEKFVDKAKIDMSLLVEPRNPYEISISKSFKQNPRT